MGSTTDLDSARDERRLLVAGIVLAGTTFAADLMIPLGVAAGVPHTLIVLIAVRSRRPGAMLIAASIASALTIVGGLMSPEGVALRFAIPNRLITLLAIWGSAFFLAHYRMSRQELRDRRLERQRYLDIVDVAIVALDEEGRVTLINKKAGEILGCDPDEAPGKSWVDNFVPERMREDVRRVHRELVSAESDLDGRFENPVLVGDGTERIIDWHNTVLRDDSGRIVGTLSSGTDVTVQKKAQQRLQEYNKRLTDMTWALDQAAIVAITDQRGKIEYVNDKFCEISRYSREELLGQDHRIINSGYHPKTFIRKLWTTIASGQVWRGELRNRTKDGSFYWVDTTIVPFLDAHGKPYQYLAIRNDITDRKRAETELRNREALAQIGQMAAVVAHEVKNPLAGIGGAVQIIGGRLPEDSPDREIIQTILDRIDALDQKVQELLLFARPRAPSLAAVSLRGLVRDIVEHLELDPRLSAVEVSISSDDVTVRGDAEQLREVFLNLLLNAAQSMQDGGRIGVVFSETADTCTARVEDDGPGIPEEIRERIFDPFFSTRNTGTGLGLAIARRIVEAHAGEISICCPKNGGTVATVVLPRG